MSHGRFWVPSYRLGFCSTFYLHIQALGVADDQWKLLTMWTLVRKCRVSFFFIVSWTDHLKIHHPIKKKSYLQRVLLFFLFFFTVFILTSVWGRCGQDLDRSIPISVCLNHLHPHVFWAVGGNWILQRKPMQFQQRHRSPAERQIRTLDLPAARWQR